MVKWIPLLLLLLAANILAAQTAYVAAPSGLKLRKAANANGVIIKTLPYETAVKYLADQSPRVAHKTKEAEGFYLNGFWKKVVAGKDTGFVFSAFLIPVEPVGKKEIETYYDDTTRKCMPFDIYFLDSRFKAFGKPYDVKKFEGEDSIYFSGGDKTNPYCQKGFSQKFANGNIVASYSQGEGGAGMDVTLKGYTFNQVYAIALSMTYYMNDYAVVTYENGIVNIGPEDGGAGCYSTIEVKGTTIIWNFGCGC